MKRRNYYPNLENENIEIGQKFLMKKEKFKHYSWNICCIVVVAVDNSAIDCTDRPIDRFHSSRLRSMPVAAVSTALRRQTTKMSHS